MLDAVVRQPANSLSFALSPLRTSDFSPVFVDVDSHVDCSDVVVDDLHELRGVLTQVKSLLRISSNVPGVLLISALSVLLVLGEGEMEQNIHLTRSFCVFERLELNHFEVVKPGLLLLISHYHSALRGRSLHELWINWRHIVHKTCFTHLSDLLLELRRQCLPQVGLLMTRVVNGAWCVKQLNTSVSLIVEVSGVSNVVWVTSVDLILSHVRFRASHVARLLLYEHQLS